MKSARIEAKESTQEQDKDDENKRKAEERLESEAKRMAWEATEEDMKNELDAPASSGLTEEDRKRVHEVTE